MPNITKALVLETFMKHYGGRPGPDEKRRAMEAFNATVDDLIPWKESMKESMSKEDARNLELVSDLLVEILAEDFKIEVRTGQKLTPTEIAGANDGMKAAQEFLKDNAHRIPPLPETDEAVKEWQRTVHSWAFDLAPKDRISDKEWTHGFVSGFASDLWQYRRSLAE